MYAIYLGDNYALVFVDENFGRDILELVYNKQREGVRLCCRKHKKKYYNRDNDRFNEGMGNGLEHIVNTSIDLGI